MTFFSKKISAFLNDIRGNSEKIDFYIQSLWSLFSKVTIAVTAIATNYIVSKTYGAEAVGYLAIFNSIVTFSSIFSTFGLNVFVLKLIPAAQEDHPDVSIKSTIDKCLYSVASFGLLITLLLITFSSFLGQLVFEREDLEFIIILSSLAIIPNAIFEVLQAAFRSIRKLESLVNVQFWISILKISLLLFASFLIEAFYAPLYIILLSILITSLLSYRKIKLALRKVDEEQTKYNLSLFKFSYLFKSSLPMLLTASATMIISHFDFLILGRYVEMKYIGYYAVAHKLALTLSFILKAINSSTAPLFSKSFIQNDFSKLKILLKRTSRMSGLFSIPLALVFFFFGKDILILFSDGFENGYSSLVILTFAQLFSSATGSVGYFLNMTGYEKSFRNIVIASSVLNVILNLLLIPNYGIFGAAIATCTSIIFNNLCASILIRVKFGFWSYGFW